MPGFPDKFMPFMDEPPGSKVSTTPTMIYGRIVRALRSITFETADKEPKWRHPGRKLGTGYDAPWQA
jgi:hydrogenase small subunit